MKRLLRLLAAAVAVLALLVAARNGLARVAVEAAVRRQTGFPLTLGAVDIHLLRGRLELTDLRLQNPKGWPDDRFVWISSLVVDYEPLSMWSGTPHVRTLRARVDEVVLVTDAQGRKNSDLLGKTVAAGDDRAGVKPAPYRVDLVELHLGKVHLLDFSRGRAERRAVVLELDVRERDLSERTNLTGIVVHTALRGVGGRLGGALKGAGDALRGAGKGIGSAGKGVLDRLRGQ